MNKYAIEAQAVCKRFSDGTGHSIDVLSGVTFAAAPGEVLAIVGASGSGKSTLLHILGGLDVPDSGRVLICGQDIGTLSDKALGDRRPGCARQRARSHMRAGHRNTFGQGTRRHA